MKNSQTIVYKKRDIESAILEQLAEHGLARFPKAPKIEGLPDDISVTLSIEYDSEAIRESNDMATQALEHRGFVEQMIVGSRNPN